MKSSRDILVALLVACTGSSVPALTSCYATDGAYGAYVVEDVPPPPREEIVVYRPGYVWVRGHWTRPGRRWVWRGGYYERVRPNAVYVEGRWERRGRGHVWIEGGWRTRRGVVVRDQ